MKRFILRRLLTAAFISSVVSAQNPVTTTSIGAETGSVEGAATITVTATDISDLAVSQEIAYSTGGLAITTQPVSTDVAAGAAVNLSVVGESDAVITYQWYRQRSGDSSAELLTGETGATLSIASASASDMGFYWAKVASDGNEVNSNTAIVTLSGGTSRLANLSTRGRIPANGALTPGFVMRGTGTKPLVVRAVGPQLLNFGVQSALTDPKMDIIPSGASDAVASNNNWGDATNAATLVTTSASLGAFALDTDSADAAILTDLPLPNSAGSRGYTVRITATDSASEGIALAEVYDPEAIGGDLQLTNVSALGFSGLGEDVLAPGFVIDGTGAKTMLIRVVGPSLVNFGVTGTMTDPKLSLIPAGQTNAIATNDNWGGTAALKAAFATTGAFELDSDASADAVILVRLPPGAYTVKPEGADGGTGTILVEAYEVIFDLLSQNAINLVVGYSQSHDLKHDVYGANNWISTRPYYLNDQGFMEKYNDLGKPTMRYPGGTPSNYLNLATGFHELPNNPKTLDISRVDSFNAGMANRGKVNGEEVGRFIDFLSQTGGKSTYVMNVGIMTIAENEQILDSIIAQGQELNYVELGNELYFSQYTNVVSDEIEYITRAKDYTNMVKSKFPDAKIGVLLPSHVYTDENFTEAVENSTNRSAKWYNALKNETFYDALIVHLYSSVGMNGQTTQANFLPYTESYKHAISHADGQLSSAFSTIKTDFPNKDVWVTEYHVGGFSGEVRNYRLRHSYLGGLYASTFLLKLFKNEQVTVGNWHSMVQWLTFSNSQATSLLPTDYDFGTAVNYDFFKIFKEPVNNASRFAEVDFGNLINYTGLGEHTGTHDDVEGGVFYDEATGKGYLLVINKLENTYVINRAALEANLYGTITTVKQYSPDTTTNATLELALKDESNMLASTISNSRGNYSLAPYSITVFNYDM